LLLYSDKKEPIKKQINSTNTQNMLKISQPRIILTAMKLLIIPLIACCLSACLFTNSNEVKRSELILSHFNCHNYEGSISPINSFHEQTLTVTKQKSVDYIQHYKDGEKLFNIPLDEVVNQQYELYKDACQSIGGVL